MRCCLLGLLVLAGTAVVRADDPTPKKPDAETVHRIPYRLTDTKHIMVRLKLNGKGPFNFILDTGAPAVFVTKAVAKKIGLEEDKKGWGTFDKFAIEGGAKVEHAKGRVADLFQLDGMNSLGLAGVELHGVVGYNVLARYRITYDFTDDKLTFVPLEFDPPEPVALGKDNSQGSMDILGPAMKTIAGLMGVKPNFTVKGSGFLGAELDEGKTLAVKKVLKGTPAAAAGLEPGDVIESMLIGKKETTKAMLEALGKAGSGDKIKLVVTRSGEKKTLTVELGKGF